MIVLDTHVLLWLVEGSDRLGPLALALIDDLGGRGVISAMSFWEIAMLADKQRIALSMPLARWREELVANGGIDVVPVDPAIAIDAGSLPGKVHGDPCDRILIATARSFDCPLMTCDRQIVDYARQGHVRIIDARR